jgi:integrin beta 2
VSLSVRNYYSLSKNVIGLDFFYDASNKHYEIFWSDVNEDKIFMGIVKNGELLNVKSIIESGLSTTEAVAIDWMAENIYWVDSSLRQIEVAKKSGLHRRTLISEDMSNPRSIALDPRVGYLFWSDWDAGNPRIERSTLAGENRKAIFLIKSLKGSWPNGITLDYVKKRIFFLDAKSKEIHTIDYDGNDDRRILKNDEYLSHPFAITIYENYIYWTDWRISGVLRADKFTGTNITMISHAISQAFDIKIMHPSRQPRIDGLSKMKENPCSAESNCSHLCLLSTSNSYKCDCPHMMRLTDDKKTCEYIDDMLLFISGSDEIKGVDLRSTIYTISTIKHATEIIAPTHIDYDPVNNRIFWSDVQLNMAKAVQLATTTKPSHQKIETIIDSSFENVIGFSIDWISELLYYVQLKPEKTIDDRDSNKFKSYRIMVSNLNGEYLSVLMDDLNEIYSFLVSPQM